MKGESTGYKTKPSVAELEQYKRRPDEVGFKSTNNKDVIPVLKEKGWWKWNTILKHLAKVCTKPQNRVNQNQVRETIRTGLGWVVTWYTPPGASKEAYDQWDYTSVDACKKELMPTKYATIQGYMDYVRCGGTSCVTSLYVTAKGWKFLKEAFHKYYDVDIPDPEPYPDVVSTSKASKPKVKKVKPVSRLEETPWREFAGYIKSRFGVKRRGKGSITLMQLESELGFTEKTSGRSRGDSQYKVTKYAEENHYMCGKEEKDGYAKFYLPAGKLKIEEAIKAKQEGQSGTLQRYLDTFQPHTYVTIQDPTGILYEGEVGKVPKKLKKIELMEPPNIQPVSGGWIITCKGGISHGK